MSARRRSSTARGYGAEHRRVRLVVLARDGYRCHWCGGRATEADHHPIPRHRGGLSVPGNMVAACRPCNATRGAIDGNQLRAERRHATPAWFLSGYERDPAAVVSLSPADANGAFAVTPQEDP